MTLRVRAFATRAEAEAYLATLPDGAIYARPHRLEELTVLNPTPAYLEKLRASQAARGYTETPCEVLETREGFAVPVPLDVRTVREPDARGVPYDRVVKPEGVDPEAETIDVSRR